MRPRMKSALTKLMVIPICLIVMIMLVAPVYAYTPIYSEAQIAAAAEKGVEWLANQQNSDGSWSDANYNYMVGNTGLALLKLETHATFMGMSPLDPAYAYSDNVQAGLNYLFANSHNVTIGVQTAGDPDTNGTGIGVEVWSNIHDREPYQAAIALMAISASNEPNEIVTVGPQIGQTYAHVAQEIVDWLAWAQNEGSYAADPDRGGWRYAPNVYDSDNSVVGYVTIGLAYAEAPAPWGFGAHVTIPGFVFDELEPWVERIQIDSGGSTGGSSYEPTSTATNNGGTGNALRTGNLLSELAILGYGPGTETATLNVTAAVDYMESVWDVNNADPGWRRSYQACFTMMKGYQGQGIETLDTGSGPESWYREMADVIVGSQNADGSFTAGSDYGEPVKSTAWALLALEKAAPPALSLTPPFDINQVGDPHTVTATYKRAGVAQENMEIEFEIISGPNDDEPITSDNTNASGEATFTYTGDGGPGTDIIKATAVLSGLSSQATKVWERTTPPVEVGGEVYAVNKLAILAPLLALFTVLIPAIIVMRRRRARS